MLYMDFRIPHIMVSLKFRGKDGKVDLNKVENFFDEESVKKLAAFPGLKWKVWSISEDGTHGAGFYLFENLSDAEIRAEYAKKFYWRKGLLFVDCRIYNVLEDYSRVTKAPIDTPANPGFTPEQIEELFNCKQENLLKSFVSKLVKNNISK